jgi:hypothetical protein
LTKLMRGLKQHRSVARTGPGKLIFVAGVAMGQSGSIRYIGNPVRQAAFFIGVRNV